jgi:hypothetical protein
MPTDTSQSRPKRPWRERLTRYGRESLILAAGFAGGVAVFSICVALASYDDFFTVKYEALADQVAKTLPTQEEPTLDKAAYDKKMWELANNGIPYASTTEPWVVTVTVGTTTSTTTKPLPPHLWPVADAPYPKAGALLPFNRIVAYYGNFYSTAMGALGEYPKDEMERRLMAEVSKWEAADPDTPVVPAIHYIVATAQGSPGADGMYRFRMPDDQIQHALDLAHDLNGIVFLDIQAGKSDLMTEIKVLEPYLTLPEVHLAIDPEFRMKYGEPPGTVIGTVDASDINAAADYLASLVDAHDLPPKILIVHRFTYDMVTHAADIKPLPEVQIVMDMDGWGDPAKKFGTYNRVIAPEPVQFTGFKLFYKNDLKPPSTRLLTPQDLLTLTPRPIYIQYQ